MLVTVQVALSLILLVGAGLMLKTFAKLAAVNTGFDKNQVLLIRVDPRYASVPLDRRLPLYQVGFFAGLETPFIAGRDFNEHDTLHAPLVAVINESMARKFFGSPLSAVGKTFRNGWNEISGPIQIVGVVKDTKYPSLRAEREAIAYYPLSQLPPMLSFRRRFHRHREPWLRTTPFLWQKWARGGGQRLPARHSYPRGARHNLIRWPPCAPSEQRGNARVQLTKVYGRPAPLRSRLCAGTVRKAGTEPLTPGAHPTTSGGC